MKYVIISPKQYKNWGWPRVVNKFFRCTIGNLPTNHAKYHRGHGRPRVKVPVGDTLCEVMDRIASGKGKSQ